MSQKKKSKFEKPFTEVELEIMNVIWSLDDCTVKDVQTAVHSTRELAYTSVATMMKILEQKGALASKKDDRVHTYHPLISRQDYELGSLRHLADNVFQGDPSAMVMRLISESKISKEELQNIRKILDERIGK
ncbi:MAG: BlaI/MecI/CopY family transcriptional regulator [Bdellovibrionales bacterium]|nr:BlaI/MecI/CopY family transcriptional regulator [Bdellovibrionales bacterium]